MDLYKRIFDEVLFEREGYAFKVEVVYERMSLFCSHSHIIGHNISNFRWLHPTKNDQLGGTKQPEHEAPKKSTQQWVKRSTQGHIGTSAADADIVGTGTTTVAIVEPSIDKCTNLQKDSPHTVTECI
jgi:hypothetical protein